MYILINNFDMVKIAAILINLDNRKELIVFKDQPCINDNPRQLPDIDNITIYYNDISRGDLSLYVIMLYERMSIQSVIKNKKIAQHINQIDSMYPTFKNPYFNIEVSIGVNSELSANSGIYISKYVKDIAYYDKFPYHLFDANIIIVNNLKYITNQKANNLPWFEYHGADIVLPPSVKCANCKRQALYNTAYNLPEKYCQYHCPFPKYNIYSLDEMIYDTCYIVDMTLKSNLTACSSKYVICKINRILSDVVYDIAYNYCQDESRIEALVDILLNKKKYIIKDRLDNISDDNIIMRATQE